MTRDDTNRWANIAAALVMLFAGLLLVLFVFPRQIPEGFDGDLSSDLYPRVIMMVWISSAAAWLVSTLFAGKENDDAAEGGSYARRSILIGLVILAGYGLFALIGFITAAFVLIVCLSYICGERGLAPWILAAIVSPSVYAFLDIFLDVRLPTFLTP